MTSSGHGVNNQSGGLEVWGNLMHGGYASVACQSAPVFAVVTKSGALWQHVGLPSSRSTWLGNCGLQPVSTHLLSDKSIGAEDSLDVVFAADHSVISVRVGRDRGAVVVDADLEIANGFTVHLIVGRVFCIGQY